MRLLHSVARDQDNTSRAAHANTANRAQQIRPAPAGRLLKNCERHGRLAVTKPVHAFLGLVSC
jgi:hypothetical protein